MDLQKTLEEIDQIKQDLARNKLVTKQLEEDLQKRELVLQDILKDRNLKNLKEGIYSFGWKEITRKAFDQKTFANDYPELLEEYKIAKTSEKFEIKIGE